MTEIIMSTLENKGYVHIPNQSEASIKNIVDALGEVIYVTDVKVNPNSRALVTSARGLDFHTDHPNAKWILWYCIDQTDKGGESLLVDAYTAYEKLTEFEKKQLSNIMLFEHQIFDDDAEFYPLVQAKHGKLIFYYSFWMVKKDLSANEKIALNSFRRAIDSTSKVNIKLQPSDVLLIDNHRFLHGRNPIVGSKNRFLKRFWIK